MVFDDGSEHILHLVVPLRELCHVLSHVIHLCQQRAGLTLDLLYGGLVCVCVCGGGGGSFISVATSFSDYHHIVTLNFMSYREVREGGREKR